MTFKLRIPGRDDFETSTAANPANPLIQSQPISKLAELAANEDRVSPSVEPPISRLAGLADITESIEARQLAADLIQAAMLVCDRHGDDEAARQAMRDECLALPTHLQADLLAHFDPTRRILKKQRGNSND